MLDTYDLIPHMTYFHWFHILTSGGHWYGSSVVKKGSQNGIGTPNNLWFDTSHDPFSLISYFDLQRSLISGGQDLHDHLRSKMGLRIESEHQKTCDSIPHMTYFHWFNILTFLEVVIEGMSNWRSDICVNISTWCMD